MPLGEGILLQQWREKRTPHKKTLFYHSAIVSSKLKIVADRHKHAAYHNKH